MSDNSIIQNQLANLSALPKSVNKNLILTVLGLPKSLEGEPSQVQLKGQIVDINLQNKVLSLKTDLGKITLQIPNTISSKVLPKPMERVDITLTPHPQQKTTAQLSPLPPDDVTVQRNAPASTNTINSSIVNSAPLSAQEATAPNQIIRAYPTTSYELKHLIRSPALTQNTGLPTKIIGNAPAQHREQPQQNSSAQADRPAPAPRSPQAHAYEARQPQTSQHQNTQNIDANATTRIQIKTIALPSAELRAAQNPNTTAAPKATTQTPAPNTANTQQNPSFSHTAPNAQNLAGQVSAKLIGFTHDLELPVIEIEPRSPKETPQILTLTRRITNISIGSQLAITPLTKDTLTTQNSAVTPQMLIPPTLDAQESWTVLNELKDTLNQPNTAQIHHGFTALTPNPSQPSLLAPTLLFFFSAIKSGNIQDWLGKDTIEALDKLGKSDLIKQLQTELGGPITQSRDQASPSQEWRSMNIPMMWQNEIQKITLHYRREGDEQLNSEDAKTSGNKTRFIMDLKFTHLGDVQLDGLFMGDEDKIAQNGARLDLILRTQESFSPSIQQHMRGLYQETLTQTNLTGELGFQRKADQWHNITAMPDAQFKDSV